MFDFIQKFIYSILEIQENLLRKKLKRNLKSSYSHSTSKRVFGNGASLILNSQTEKNKEKVKENIELIIKKYGSSPESLLEFVQKKGTKVYKVAFADKITKQIGYEEGFISSLKGLKALYLTLCLKALGENVKVSLSTEPMFVLRNLPLDSCYFLQQFYKWYGAKYNLPGYDTESQENFQKFLSPSNDDKLKELSVDEILGLKEAIARDVEAINFVVELAKSTTGSKNALKKVTTGGASI